MWKQQSQSTQEAGGLLFTTLAVRLVLNTCLSLPTAKAFPKAQDFQL